jgi:hypothetical protein
MYDAGHHRRAAGWHGPDGDTVDNQRNRGAKIAGVQVFGSEAGSVRHIRPKRVIFHLTEDRALTSPSK